MLLKHLNNKITAGKKAFALLIDPDKFSLTQFEQLLENIAPIKPDVILVGGSLLFGDINQTILDVKQLTNIPIYIFPGSSMQVSAHANGILFTSLISGRNPEFLIGHQVNAAPIIKQYELDTIATGYILIDSDNSSAVRYMSNTTPIPTRKTDIAVATALAGEMLGLRTIYLEAGSGASAHVPTEMIEKVKKQLSIPLIVGGGIRSAKSITDVYQAGADLIVMGNAFEKNEINLADFKAVMNQFL